MTNSEKCSSEQSAALAPSQSGPPLPYTFTTVTHYQPHLALLAQVAALVRDRGLTGLKIDSSVRNSLEEGSQDCSLTRS